MAQVDGCLFLEHCHKSPRKILQRDNSSLQVYHTQSKKIGIVQRVSLGQEECI